MEGCLKTSAGVESGLPDDPLVEILSRVPAKSVCRFKCVSKSWHDLIADPHHRKKLRQAMQGLFVQASEFEDKELARIGFSFINLAAVRSVPLDIDPSFSFITEPTGIKTFFFLDSCNGLILLGHYQELSHVSPGAYVVCNPTTKQWLVMPACGSRDALSHTYLAFDPVVSSHFHLVQFQMPDVGMEVVSLHVYSSETGTWSENQFGEQEEQGHLDCWRYQFKLEVLDYHCAFVNGFLHLIVWGPVRQHILIVDIQGKARWIIPAPRMAHWRRSNSTTSYLGQSQGHLHCVTIDSTDENNDKISTWILQDYDTQEWVLNRTVNSLDVFGETGVRPEYQVVDIHQDCNMLFFFHQLTCELIAYDMDRKEASVIATFIKDYKFRGDFVRYVPYFSESPALTNQH